MIGNAANPPEKETQLIPSMSQARSKSFRLTTKVTASSTARAASSGKIDRRPCNRALPTGWGAVVGERCRYRTMPAPAAPRMTRNGLTPPVKARAEATATAAPRQCRVETWAKLQVACAISPTTATPRPCMSASIQSMDWVLAYSAESPSMRKKAGRPMPT